MLGGSIMLEMPSCIARETFKIIQQVRKTMNLKRRKISIKDEMNPESIASHCIC